MKVVQVPGAAADFQIVERGVPSPGPGEVRIKVEACGLCHSDAFAKEGLWPGLRYPRVPGHEIAGRVDAVGEGVEEWRPGDRVGIGWHGSHCFRCDACRAGDFINCGAAGITGLTIDGGYAEYATARAEGLARIPDALDSVSAAPLMCAGITTYNSLRNSGARPGDLVAIHGIGGLGHLGVQFASKMGFRTAALSRGADKEKLARDLGAEVYIDTDRKSPAEALQALGGARVILATAPSSRAISSLVDGLGINGNLVIVGASAESLTVSPLQLISGRRRISGWASGHAGDSEDAMRFAALTGVRPMVERFPLERAAEAYARMMSNQARFRAVLEIG